MPNPLSVPITPPRVAFIDPRTNTVSREWYMFFLSLFQLTGGSSISLDDVQKSPQPLTVDELTLLIDQAVGNLTPAFGTSELQAVLETVRQELQTLPVGLIDQIAELRKKIESLQIAPPPREFKRARYGQFFDTTTQTAAVINTAHAITFNTTDISEGVYIGSPTSRIYVDEPSTYNFLFSIQLDKTSGGTANFWIWSRINGIDVPNSASQIRIQGNDAEIFTSVGFLFNLAAGDYVELMFEVSDISVELVHFPLTAVHPAIPSIILTVTDNIKGV
jgi:hypothetical protein